MSVGVHKTKSGTWAARCYKSRGPVYVGTFATEELAVEARAKKLLELPEPAKRVHGGSLKLSHLDGPRIDAMLAQGMLRDHIAYKMGVSRATLHRFLNGLGAYPKVMK